MSPWGEVALCATVLTAASVQRVTGIGFSLVSAPFLVLMEGPEEGVLLANVLSCTTNLLVLAQIWRDIELKRVMLLAVPALCLIPVGHFVAHSLPPAPLMVGIGGVVLGALGSLRWLRRSALFAGPGGAIAAGALSGFMNVTAGVGGPAITLYAITCQWPHRSFVASIQLYFALVNGFSVIVKGLPHGQTASLITGLAALMVGLALGQFLSSRVSVEFARRLVLALAVAGALGTVLKGLFLMVR